MIGGAFVLGAGLGTRLRPLTARVPKPLIPIFQKPLVTFALDHLVDLGVGRVAINTHHGAECWGEVFPSGDYRGLTLELRHEPVLLETGGGIKNVEDLFGAGPFLVYNADVLTDLPVDRLARHHLESGNAATLALRSGGGPGRVAFDAARGAVLDLANRRGTGLPQPHVFTGVYALSPEIFAWLEPGRAESVVRAFLRMIEAGERVGGIVLDEGEWHDLGTVDAYRAIHGLLRERPSFPSYPARAYPGGAGIDWREPIHPGARVCASARVEGGSVVGAGAEIGPGALVRDCVVWPQSRIASGARLRDCIVVGAGIVEGEFERCIL